MHIVRYFFRRLGFFGSSISDFGTLTSLRANSANLPHPRGFLCSFAMLVFLSVVSAGFVIFPGRLEHGPAIDATHDDHAALEPFVPDVSQSLESFLHDLFLAGRAGRRRGLCDVVRGDYTLTTPDSRDRLSRESDIAVRCRLGCPVQFVKPNFVIANVAARPIEVVAQACDSPVEKIRDDEADERENEPIESSERCHLFDPHETRIPDCSQLAVSQSFPEHATQYEQKPQSIVDLAFVVPERF